MIFRRQPAYPTGEGLILLLPAEKFVARHVPLTGGMDIMEQVELAVEACSPLPLNQLCWGFGVAPDRGSAIAWMASRKHFSAEEMAAWTRAAAVLPASLALCQPPAFRPSIVLHREQERLEAAAWEQTAASPVLLLARICAPGESEVAARELLQEVRRRTGLTAAEVIELEGPVSAALTADQSGLLLHCGGCSALWRWSELGSADLRNRDQLAEIGRRIGWERLLWRASVAAAVLVMVAALTDLATAVGASWLEKRNRFLRERTMAVTEIQADHALAHRLGELAQQRLRFMEMLDVLNGSRPAGLLFVRVVSAGPHALEIRARTPHADDARLYESALKNLPELRSVRVSDLQTRDGQTDFLLLTEFRSETKTEGGGMP